MICSKKKKIHLEKNNYLYKGTIYKDHSFRKGKLVNRNVTVVGSWKENILNGICEVYYYKYYFKGNFKNGKPNGYGKLITDSLIYKGYFKNGVAEGKGKLYNMDNKFLCSGVFKNNKMINKDIIINHPFSDIQKYIN